MPVTKTRSTSPKDVSSKISDFLATLTKPEKSLLKSKLSSKIPDFFNEHNHLSFSENYSQEDFHNLAETLYKLAHFRKTVPKNGITYIGHPEWVTDCLLEKLQEEAVIRRDEPLDRVDHFLGCGGKQADILSTNPEVLAFVSKHVGPVEPTGITSYLYYDSPGLGIRPHVDTNVFSINLMLMLKHQPPSTQSPSSTLVFPAWGETESYRLQIGEVMLMFGGSVVHARSIIGEDEKIHLLTIGFNEARS